ncbi:MAG: hypothetical protein HY537_11500 [Deltaproteobacteria bacterium]|nr:hypothetical protein [Deltaproteobacteria bacterium]
MITISAETIARKLKGRRTSVGWICHCPSHDDKRPSLAVAEGRHGRVLVYCFAGCKQWNVIRRLEQLGLWNSFKKGVRLDRGLYCR